MPWRVPASLVVLLVCGDGLPIASTHADQLRPCQPDTAGFNALQDRQEAAAAPSALLAKLELARCLDLSWKFDEVAPAVEVVLDLYRAELHVNPTGKGPGPLMAGRDVALPSRTRMLTPHYPDQASADGTTGIVVVEALIDREGRVKRAEIALSIPALDKAALDVVRSPFPCSRSRPSRRRCSGSSSRAVSTARSSA